MCGILGLFNKKNANSLVKVATSCIKNRGRDGYGISSKDELKINKKKLPTLNNSENIVVHLLHSVVSKVPQPFISENKKKKTKSIFLTNCEIYNWKKLSEKYNLKPKNDADLIFQLLEKKSISALDELDGDYALCYWKNNKVYLARDLVGIKPLWFYYDKKNKTFAFASERKALVEIGLNPEELNPRKLIVYDIKTKKLIKTERDFFSYTPEIKKTEKEITKKLYGLIVNAISKRIPNEKIGLLFSGGVDSTVIAHILKKLNVPFTCYVSAIERGDMKSEDLFYAKKAAKDLNLNLKILKLKIEDIPKYLEKIVPLIEDSNVTKVGVALPFFIACEQVKKDNVKVVLSGLGSEEIFAGYERHLHSKKINSECLAGLQKMHERDLYRDDVVTMYNSIELRVPFLDKDLISYAIKIPGKFKIKNKNGIIIGKYILRKMAEQFDVPKEYSWRKKRAAQYGSRFDKAISILAKKNKFKYKSEYLNQFYKTKNLKLGILFSGGKDSVYATHIMHGRNYEISCLISIESKNKDSYMFHTPNIRLTELQAKAMGIPLLNYKTKGEKELELQDLKKAIKSAIKKYEIQGIVTGALFSDYQRERIEKITDELGIKIFSPLWHMSQEKEMQQVIKIMELCFSSIAAEGLDKFWLARKITERDLEKLIKLNKEVGINVAGEGGEFESLILDAPLFKKKIEIIDFKISEENENTARMVVKKAKLVKK